MRTSTCLPTRDAQWVSASSRERHRKSSLLCTAVSYAILGSIPAAFVPFRAENGNTWMREKSISRQKRRLSSCSDDVHQGMQQLCQLLWQNSQSSDETEKSLHDRLLYHIFGSYVPE